MRGLRTLGASLLTVVTIGAGVLAIQRWGPANDGVRSTFAGAAPAERAGRTDPAITRATPHVESRAFVSASLRRGMPYLVYLPPDYAATSRRYPVLYLLHGLSGSDEEWRTYGIFDVAEKMIRARQIDPLIIVLPQGDQAYWVDHANGGERWGAYTARDVVAEVDAHFRTLPDVSHRAIGGVSMGAHGAVQLMLNYPGTFGVVGAHSLVLRRFGSAPAYFGDREEFAKRDPMQLIFAKADIARGIALWIDIGDRDPWAELADQFEDELRSLQIAHSWHEWPGDHSGAYWSAHLPDYLRFYDAALHASESAGAVDGTR